MIIRWAIVKILLVEYPSDVNDTISMLGISESTEALASSDAFGADHFLGSVQQTSVKNKTQHLIKSIHRPIRPFILYRIYDIVYHILYMA